MGDNTTNYDELRDANVLISEALERWHTAKETYRKNGIILCNNLEDSDYNILVVSGHSALMGFNDEIEDYMELVPTEDGDSLVRLTYKVDGIKIREHGRAITEVIYS